MRKPRPVILEEGPKVPGYIVTFSDMVTLLLTFFVMLLTLADVQDPELFNKGRDSFIESLKYIGLGALFGREETPHFGHVKDKHSIAEPDESPDRRTIDAEAERIRRLFAQIKQVATVVPLQIGAKRADFSVVNVHFSPGSATLDESGRKFLTGFCRDLQQDGSGEPVELYVLGLAAEAKGEEEQWVLSAKRAQTVADFLRDALSTISHSARPALTRGQPRWFIRSWGAGPGGDWVGRNSPVSGQSHVLIGMLRSRE